MIDTEAYLRRLRISDPGPPSSTALRALQAAHVERIAYEALDIQLGIISSIDPVESAARITKLGRGGYCYHLNGALSLLLQDLGYDVVWHKAGIQNRADPGPRRAELANHLALTVHGLPGDDCPSGVWLVDVGLGDALHEPLPLHEGTYTQGPFSYVLRRSEVEPGGWRLDHDPAGSFKGMDFAPERATLDDFTDRHVFLSTSPESGFVRTCAVQRRDAAGVDVLTGLVLRRMSGRPGRTRVIEDRAEWFEVLDDVFGLALTDLDAAAKDALWGRVCRAHEVFLQSGRCAI